MRLNFSIPTATSIILLVFPLQTLCVGIYGFFPPTPPLVRKILDRHYFENLAKFTDAAKAYQEVRYAINLPYQEQTSIMQHFVGLLDGHNSYLEEENKVITEWNEYNGEAWDFVHGIGQSARRFGQDGEEIGENVISPKIKDIIRSRVSDQVVASKTELLTLKGRGSDLVDNMRDLLFEMIKLPISIIHVEDKNLDHEEKVLKYRYLEARKDVIAYKQNTS